jgi:Domain of unknown function (DUF4186)
MAQKLEPLKVRCTSADCGNDLHCFRKSREMAASDRGKCRYCRADLIDWARVQRRDVRDVAFTFNELKNEMIRHHFWHVEIDEKAINHALRKGRVLLNIASHKRLVQSVGRVKPFHDGFQTPYSGNIIYYAQHAVAACCRKCVDYWHGIPEGRALTEDEIEYLDSLVNLYIKERLPDLPDRPTKIRPAGRR